MWMIYGATGYTGTLIAREAAMRGERPVLAGRNAEKVQALARELECEWRAFDAEAPDLSGISLVLHCAGPFIHTSKPMVKACLEAGVHYVDITGEIAVFESVLRRNEEAVQRGVTLLPGAGFDVVPTDCLAAMLKEKLPDANELWLAFHMARGGTSRGTLKTMIEGIGIGGAIRRDGKIIVVPHMYDVREIPFSIGSRLCVTIPWGDVSTAYHTTGIPNIRTYKSMSPRLIARMRRFGWLTRLAKVGFVKRLMQGYVDRGAPGPNETEREQGRVYLWGRVTNAKGEEATMTMEVREGYSFTVLSALAVVNEILKSPRPGAFTPARLFGPDFVKRADETCVVS